MVVQSRPRILGLFVGLILALGYPFLALSEPEATLRRDMKASLGTGSLKTINLAPLSLRGGSQLTLSSPEMWEPLAHRITTTLATAHDRFVNLFGEIPAFSTAVRLMDEDTFFATTGAPRWTNAMYYKDQIIIPLGSQASKDLENIYRAVRHEFTHAVIHALSAGRAPGWIDEGLAQWAEGPENPALQTALRDWLSENEAVPFRLLQGGFTKLDTRMVPAADAESLFATQALIQAYGFENIRLYFSSLRKGSSREASFLEAYKLSEAEFERRLKLGLNSWVHGD